MKPESFLDGKAILYCGDCLEVLEGLAENTFDSVVTDPPYALVSISKRFGKDGAAPCKTYEGKSGAYKRASRGFMGKKWDTGDTAHAVEFWRECLRVLKPGGHVLAFAGTRTYHRLACAIEDAGFEIRDMVQWLCGSGFPKSQNVAKFIDRELEVTGKIGGPRSAAHAAMLEAGVARRGKKHEGWDRPWMDDPEAITAAQSTYIPGSPQAQEFDGFGTALKPACEPICMARKPLERGLTVAGNVLRWRTGALNIGASRVPGEMPTSFPKRRTPKDDYVYEAGFHKSAEETAEPSPLGRWPANVVTDGSDEVVAMFPESGPSSDSPRNNAAFKSVAKGYEKPNTTYGHEDSGGSAARFFWSSKAGFDDRLGSKHPTVKPIDLMQYLVRLVTPPGGLVLDPFAGTGVTAEACYREGMRCTMVERETEYQSDIRRRMALVLAGPDERQRESIKATIKAKGLPVDNGPLFE